MECLLNAKQRSSIALHCSEGKYSVVLIAIITCIVLGIVCLYWNLINFMWAVDVLACVFVAIFVFGMGSRDWYRFNFIGYNAWFFFVSADENVHLKILPCNISDLFAEQLIERDFGTIELPAIVMPLGGWFRKTRLYRSWGEWKIRLIGRDFNGGTYKFWFWNQGKSKAILDISDILRIMTAKSRTRLLGTGLHGKEWSSLHTILRTLMDRVVRLTKELHKSQDLYVRTLAVWRDDLMTRISEINRTTRLGKTLGGMEMRWELLHMLKAIHEKLGENDQVGHVSDQIKDLATAIVRKRKKDK